MREMNVSKVVHIDLKGQHLTLEVSDTLLDKVKETFMLDSIESVTDAQLKYYIVSSMRNAIERADNGREAVPGLP